MSTQWPRLFSPPSAVLISVFSFLVFSYCALVSHSFLLCLPVSSKGDIMKKGAPLLSAGLGLLYACAVVVAASLTLVRMNIECPYLHNKCLRTLAETCVHLTVISLFCSASTLCRRWEGLSSIEGSLESILLSAAACRESSSTPRTEPALLISLSSLLVSAPADHSIEDYTGHHRLMHDAPDFKGLEPLQKIQLALGFYCREQIVGLLYLSLNRTV